VRARGRFYQPPVIRVSAANAPDAATARAMGIATADSTINSTTLTHGARKRQRDGTR